jgi:hypothetical protein
MPGFSHSHTGFEAKTLKTYRGIWLAIDILYMLCVCCIVISIDRNTRIVGRDSSVGIATRYVLDGPGIESRWEMR